MTFGPHCIYIYLLCFPQELEKALDVFNIVLARQQVQMEVWQHVPKQKATDILTFLIRCSKFAFSLHRWWGQDRSWLLKRPPLKNRVEEASSAAFLARKKGRKKRKRKIKSLRVSVFSLIYLLNVPLNKCFFDLRRCLCTCICHQVLIPSWLLKRKLNSTQPLATAEAHITLPYQSMWVHPHSVVNVYFPVTFNSHIFFQQKISLRNPTILIKIHVISIFEWGWKISIHTFCSGFNWSHGFSALTKRYCLTVIFVWVCFAHSYITGDGWVFLAA